MKYDSNNKIVYEVGDWVMPNGVGHTRNNSHFPLGVIIEVTKILQDKKESYVGFDNPGRTTGFANVRPATQEEIDKATKEEKIMVGEYEVEFLRKSFEEIAYELKIGCQGVTKETFLKIAKKAGWL